MEVSIATRSAAGGMVPAALSPMPDLEAATRTFVESTVAMVFNVSPEALRAPTRSQAEVAFARQVAMYVLHVVFGWSLTAAGEAFGRDRTTAGHACRMVEDRRDDPTFDRVLVALERAVSSCESAARAQWGEGIWGEDA